MTNPICCGKEAQYYEDVTIEGIDAPGYGYYCDVCQNKVAHPDKEEAKKEFLKNAKPAPKPVNKVEKKETKPSGNAGYNKGAKVSNNNSLTVHSGKTEVLGMFNNREALMKIVSPIVDNSKGAVERLIKNTYRYVENLKGKGYDDLWATEEGTAAIIREVEEALMMGLELGKAGDIVPFGQDCSFIPDVQGVIFALTTGKNAPFKWVEIDVEYEGDVVISGRKTGNFFVDFKSMGEERVKPKAVYVYGLHNKTGLIKGEKYDTKRLLEKAREHSAPYKNYMKIIDAFEYAKSQGKVEKDANGREFFKYFVIKDASEDKYFEQSVEEFRKQEAAGTLQGSGSNQYAVQELPKKGGGTWEKKIYRRDIEGGMEEKTIYPDDLKNPYAGPDQPEMLIKTAGKSFLLKFLRTRNSEAAQEEIKSSEDAKDRAFSDIIGEAEDVE